MVIQQEMMQGLRGGALASVVTTKDPFPGYQFCASHSYESSQADELSVTIGARVRVLETSDCGWWLCRYVGWGSGGPSLTEAGPSANQTPPSPTGSKAVLVFSQLQYCSLTGWAHSSADHGSTSG